MTLNVSTLLSSLVIVSMATSIASRGLFGTWQEDVGSNGGVRGQCKTFNGSGLFSIRYAHTGHHNHPSDRKLLPLSMMKNLITCGQDDPEEALAEAVLVVLSRLGRLDRSLKCHPPPPGVTIYDHARTMAQNFTRTHMPQIQKNVSAMLEQPHLNLFMKALLQFGLSTESCCGGNNRQCHMGAHHLPEMRNMTSVFKLLLHFYDRHAQLPGSASSLKYLNLANAHRFLCVDQDTFNKSTNKPTVSRDTIAHMVLYIVLGYNFKGVEDVCPITFIQNIFKYHAGSNDMMLSDRELRTLMQNMNLTDTNSGAHVSTTEATNGDINTTGNDRTERAAHTFHRPMPGGPRIVPDDPNIPVEMAFLDMSELYQLSVGEAVESPQINKCFSSREIIRIFRKEPSHGSIDTSTFVDICPVLLQQVLTDSCRIPNIDVPTEVPVNTNSTDNDTEPMVAARTGSAEYLYGSFSILVISACSLVGVVFVKFTQSKLRHYIMGSLLALAVGCLVADAVLHLLPEISALPPVEETGEKGELLPENLKKLCALLASIYAFFMLELYLSRHSHSHSHGPVPVEDNTIVVKNNQLQAKYSSSGEEVNLQQWRKIENNLNNKAEEPGCSAGVMEIARADAADTRSETVETISVRNESAKEKTSSYLKGKRSLAWMIIIGDGIHNFADGLAVGAAFSLSFTKGLSTSITVLCHELPHELGDFAVLLSTGMTVRRAVVLNFLSSLTAFAGLYLGLGLGDQPEACKWIFAVGAGMFLYVALTDLIPECKEYFKTTPDWKMALGQNLGILIGYTGMLLLAMFEDRLEI